uniref:Uncharacterized protein n=1 Tax=Arundo donax TaxID=35708 RepID=A0A0A9DMD3_ARUDO
MSAMTSSLSCRPIVSPQPTFWISSPTLVLMVVVTEPGKFPMSDINMPSAGSHVHPRTLLPSALLGARDIGPGNKCAVGRAAPWHKPSVMPLLSM